MLVPLLLGIGILIDRDRLASARRRGMDIPRLRFRSSVLVLDRGQAQHSGELPVQQRVTWHELQVGSSQVAQVR